jgi:hypothetical protein
MKTSDERAAERDVVVCVPTGPGTLRIEIVQFLFTLLRWANRQPTPTRLHLVANATMKGVDFARNDLLRRTRKEVPNYTEILFIDNDIAPTEDCLRVLDIPGDIVAGLVHFPIAEVKLEQDPHPFSTPFTIGPMSFYLSEHGVPIASTPVGANNDLVYEVDAVGFSFCRISRWLLEDPRMEHRWYVDFEGNHAPITHAALVQDRATLESMPCVFFTPRNACGHTTTTEDVNFCMRAKKLGARILIDTKARPDHAKTFWTNRVGEAIYNASTEAGFEINEGVLAAMREERLKYFDDMIARATKDKA